MELSTGFEPISLDYKSSASPAMLREQKEPLGVQEAKPQHTLHTTHYLTNQTAALSSYKIVP